MMNYQILSYNIRFDCREDGENAFMNRLPLIAQTVLANKPHIICTQELTTDMGRELMKSLPGYAMVGLGREQTGRGESANILFRTDSFVLGNAKTEWLSDTPDVRGSRYEDSDQSFCPRTLTYALFLPFAQGETPFWVYSIHTDHIGKEARAKAVRRTLSVIRAQREKDGFPAYLAGDFNAEPQDAEITQISRLAPELRDLTDRIKVTYHGFMKPGYAGVKIDYVYVTPEWKCDKTFVWTARQGNVQLSDHFPIETDVTL